jgi:hypothetical protein
VTLVEATPADLNLSAAKLAAHANRFGVSQLYQAMMQEVHRGLGENGYTVTFTCDRKGLRPQVTLEYRDVAWTYVVGMTDALRPGTSSGTGLGMFAGAMGAGATASGLAITYRAGMTAHVRVAIDRNDDGT